MNKWVLPSFFEGFISTALEFLNEISGFTDNGEPVTLKRECLNICLDGEDIVFFPYEGQLYYAIVYHCREKPYLTITFDEYFFHKDHFYALGWMIYNHQGDSVPFQMKLSTAI